MGHWQHRCTGCILDAWVREARRARAEREEALRALLLRKGALLSARYARGWFGARRQRAAQRRCAAARASLVGAAWRGWLRLIEARRRREDLEWLFGPDMGGLEAQLETKALQVIATLRDEARAATQLQSAAHEARGIRPQAGSAYGHTRGRACIRPQAGSALHTATGGVGSAYGHTRGRVCIRPQAGVHVRVPGDAHVVAGVSTHGVRHGCMRMVAGDTARDGGAARLDHGRRARGGALQGGEVAARAGGLSYLVIPPPPFSSKAARSQLEQVAAKP